MEKAQRNRIVATIQIASLSHIFLLRLNILLTAILITFNYVYTRSVIRLCNFIKLVRNEFVGCSAAHRHVFTAYFTILVCFPNYPEIKKKKTNWVH